MFKIIDRPEFTHTVPVMVPSDGGHREESLKTRYRVLSNDQAESFQLNTTEGLMGFLKETIVSLDDLVDAAGKPVAYSLDVRDQVLGLPYARLALLRGYMTAVTKARVGN